MPVTVIVPVNVPADIPTTVDDTVTVAGVVPVAGETDSHEAPITPAVKVVFGLALTARLCIAGETPPAVAVNENEVGLTVSVVAGLTTKVTGMVEVWPLPVTVTVPVKVPAERPLTLDETVKVAGVVPVAGETVSQGAPLTLAVKVVLALAESERLWEPGDAPPAVAENESDAGLTVSVAAGFTVKVTGTLAVLPLALTVMVPVRVPADNPLTLGETVNVAGVVPVEGDT